MPTRPRSRMPLAAAVARGGSLGPLLALGLAGALACGCGATLETRDEPLRLAPAVVSAGAPLGLPFGKSPDEVDQIASDAWSTRPSTCTNGRINTIVTQQKRQMVLDKTTLNECSYVESECDDLPSPDPRLQILRCDYPGTLSGVDGRELVLLFFDRKLGGVGLYDSFIDEPTARDSGNGLVTELNALLHVPAMLTKPRAKVSDPGSGRSATITQRISWSTPESEVKLELLELDNHVWSLAYLTLARDLAVWFAGTDAGGHALAAADDGGVAIGGSSQIGGVTTTPARLDSVLDQMAQLGDQTGLCAAPSNRPPPENAVGSSISF